MLVERRTKHELYGKIVGKSSKYHAHDEKGEYKLATWSRSPRAVRISKTKSWVVTRLVQKAAAVSQPTHEAFAGPRAKRPERWNTGVRPFSISGAGTARSKNMIKVGDKLPAGKLQEFIEVEGNGCSIGPNSFDVEQLTARGKTIAIFGLPGAYTPTCSAKHVPGYVEKFDELKKAGVDEIWCVSVNDAFVMGAWGRDQKTAGKVRMMADGSADFAKATGLTLDLGARGMGCAPTAIRCWSSTAWSRR